MKLSKCFNSPKTISKIEQLYGEKESARKIREITRYKSKVFFVSVISSIVIFMSLSLIANKDEYIESIERNAPEKGNKSVSVTAHFEGMDKEEKMLISVKEQQYTKEEILEYEKGISEEIWQKILGENSSLDEVYTDLNLVNRVKGYPFSITWKSEKPMIISSKGIVNKEKVKEEISSLEQKEILVRLWANLKYGDFSEDIYGYVKLVADDRKTYSNFLENLKRKMDELDNESRESERRKLPQQVDGIRVTYSINSESQRYIVLMLGLVCAVGLVIGKDKELDKKIKEMDEELNRDYPKILSQYALYACAGMSHRNIWSTICQRYEEEVKRGGKKSFAYEEMKNCEQKMQGGMGEMTAYEEFAKRCGNVKYRAFINVIQQAVKKGKEDLNIVLDEEVDKARREENTRVRMAAQELSTKLLFPMILMLLIVIVIVIVPAFISFNG